MTVKELKSMVSIDKLYTVTISCDNEIGFLFYEELYDLSNINDKFDNKEVTSFDICNLHENRDVLPSIYINIKK